MIQKIYFILISTFISVYANADSFQVGSPSPGSILLKWSDVGFQSFIKEEKISSGGGQNHYLNSISGTKTLTRLSGDYKFTLFDCTDVSYPPGSNIICESTQLVRTQHVLPICTDFYRDIPDDFNASQYNVYIGDLDSDNLGGDLLFYGKKQIVLIHGDVIVPIILEAPSGFKLIKQANGDFLREANEHMCEEMLVSDLDENSISSLVQNGVIQKINPASIQTASFNSDDREDLLIRSGQSTYIFHWLSDGPEMVSQLNIPSSYQLKLNDTNNDGRSDIQVFNGGIFVRVFIANSQGLFFDGSSGDGEEEKESKLKTIETTWQQFSNAIINGDHATSLQYLTPNFSVRFQDILDVLGDDAGEVVEQVESIAPYYVDNKVAIFLVKKRDDNNEVVIHTLTFKVSENGSWKIEEM